MGEVKRFHFDSVCGDTGLIDEEAELKWWITNVCSVTDLKDNWISACDKLNELAEENEQLKQKITELDSENEKLWETCYHTLQFARHEDITITRNDRGHYHVCSKNVTPKDSPIISITAPSVLFNEYIINQIIEAIDKIPPVQEKEEG